jgi:hypothetical protein
MTPKESHNYDYSNAGAYYFDAYGVSLSAPTFRFERKSRAKKWVNNSGKECLPGLVQISE